MQLLQSRRNEARAPRARARNGNGGFPEPPAGEPIRSVRRSHSECGADTRIRLPRTLPEAVVCRVVCEGCHKTYQAAPAGAGPRPAQPLSAAAAGTSAAAGAATVAATSAAAGAEPSGLEARVADALLALRDRIEDGIDAARDALDELPRPDLPEIPRERLWTWASIPLAVLGVVAGLLLIQGSDAQPTPAPAAASTATEAEFIEQPGYSLALPTGWEQTNPPDGAAFSAASTDGMADATLWIERAPKLSFERFEQRSLSQLAELGGKARVVDRVEGPTVESSIVELRADVPVGEGATAPYRVTLRAAGPFRHYFVTVTQPGADPDLLADVELMHGSLRPNVQLAGSEEDGS